MVLVNLDQKILKFPNYFHFLYCNKTDRKIDSELSPIHPKWSIQSWYWSILVKSQIDPTKILVLVLVSLCKFLGKIFRLLVLMGMMLFLCFFFKLSFFYDYFQPITSNIRMAHYYYCLLFFAIILSKLSIAKSADEGGESSKYYFIDFINEFGVADSSNP